MLPSKFQRILNKNPLLFLKGRNHQRLSRDQREIAQQAIIKVTLAELRKENIENEYKTCAGFDDYDPAAQHCGTGADTSV